LYLSSIGGGATGAAASIRVSLPPVPCLPTAFIIYIDSLREGSLPGGIPQTPVAAKAKTNGCSVTVVPGIAQEPAHALYSLHCPLPIFSLWLLPFNSVEND
jgi:hypothetical protein